MMAPLAQGFWNLWSNEIWNQSIRHAIYWYLKANQGGSGLGVDTALILSQTALELLSWTYCVKDRKMISEAAFNPRSLSAADKLRLLISQLGIPLEIPQKMKKLNSRPGGKWRDSMDALTSLRNNLVHPGKDLELLDGTYAEAWQLSMWYFDLTLLAIFSFSGQYPNRLKHRWIGDVEPVPWTV